MASTLEPHVIAQRLQALPADRRAFFRSKLAEQGIDSWTLPILPRPADQTEAPLSNGQERLWLIDQLDQGAALYNLSTLLEIRGPLDIDALRWSVEQLIGRHAILRTTYRQAGAVCSQHILTEWPDALAIEGGFGEAEWEQRARALCSQRFDLAQDLPLRLHLIPAGRDRWRLLIILHHIAFDAWSQGPLVRDLAAFYAFRTGASDSVPSAEPRLQYADIAVWQRDWCESEDCRRQIAYWQDHLAGLSPPAALPSTHDAPAPATRTHKGEDATLSLDAATTDRLRRLARDSGTTVYNVVRAMLALLIGRHTDEDDVCIGTTVANREREEIADQIGFFANTLAIRHRIDRDARFDAFLRTVSDTMNAALDHQQLPYDAMLNAIDRPRDVPLFRVLLVQQNVPRETLQLGALTLHPLPLGRSHARFDLTIRIDDGPDGLALDIEYAADFFTPADIARLKGDLEGYIVQLLARPDLPLQDLHLRSAPSALRGPMLAMPPRTGWQMFASASPSATALRLTDRSIDYARLTEEAERLSARLGKRHREKIGLLLPRSVAQVATMLALWRSGAAWVPLDPAMPDERLHFIADDAHLTAIVGTGRAPDWLPEGMEWIDSDAPCAAEAGAESHVEISSADIAYVIYTSGSTGLPKGVAVSHAALQNYCLAAAQAFDWPQQATLGALASVAADLGFTALWGALLTGRTLRLLSEDECADPEALAQALATTPVDILKIVPSHLEALLFVPDAARLLPRRALILGGETTAPQLLDDLRRIAPDLAIWNHYGPTETTVGVAVHRLTSGSAPHLTTILANTALRVLDRHGRPAVPGASGELWIGGAQLAQGYLGADEAARRKFMDRADGERLYATGDRVRLLADGTGVAFLGRMDHQVKISGYRVELGEIEQSARRIAGITGAVAFIVPRGTGPKLALACTGTALDPSAVRDRLHALLPHYMVPQEVRTFQAFPMLGNGKIDRKRLASEWGENPGLPLAGSAAGSSSLVLAIAELFTEILERPAGPDTSFAALGGDSIMALRLAAKARARNFAITPALLLEHQTPAALGAALAGLRTGDAAEDDETSILLTLFRETLDRPRLQSNDNFFANGGDSILALQLAGRARRAGMEVAPRDIFAHPTVGALAATLKRTVKPSALHVLQPGETVPLSPIQRWFFAQPLDEPGHWNQAVLLDIDGPVQVEAMTAALRRLQRRHPVLSLRFVRGGDGEWTQSHAPGEPLALTIEECTAAELDSRIAAANQHFDLSRAPLMRACLYRPDAGGTDHLLLIAHHLIVDGVSWRILVDDLWTAYCAEASGHAASAIVPENARPLFPAEDETALAERAREYWLSLIDAADNAALLPIAAAQADRRHAATARVQWSLSETQRWLDRAEAEGLSPQDLLIASLCEAAGQWLDRDSLLVEMEGHGRDDPARDLSGAVGWFTSRYPLLFDWHGEADRRAIRHNVARRIRQVPDGGRGFGLLRHDPAELAAFPEAPISFNFHGRMAAGAEGIALSSRKLSGLRHPRNRRAHAIDVGAAITGGRLTVEWHFPADVPEIAQAAHAMADILQAEMPEPELAGLPLSPTQAGMLFHSLTDEGRGDYLNQVVVQLDGPLDPALFRQAWQAVLDHHAILRFRYEWQDVAGPRQFAMPEVPLPWTDHDWRHDRQSERLDADAARRALAELGDAELAAGFDLAAAPLMRIALAQLDEERFGLVWTRHHLIADGWCTARIIGEVSARYQALRRGEAMTIPASRPYRHFIEWQAAQDFEAGSAYWTALLEDLREPARLPATPCPQPGTGHVERSIGHSALSRLQAYAVSAKVTINTLCQAALGATLCRFGGRSEAVIGMVSAGRPVDLAGSDEMIGMFITTVPLRIAVPLQQDMAEWLRMIQRQASASREHEHVPLTTIRAAAPGSGTLFETLLVFENYPAARRTEDDGLTVSTLRTLERTSYPLSCIVVPGADLAIRMVADLSAIDLQTAERIADAFVDSLTRIAEGTEGDQPIGLLDPPAGEAAHLLTLGAGPLTDRRFIPLGKRLSHAARAHPDAIALSWAEGQLDYTELERRSNRLAHWLIAQGAGAETRIGLLMDRSPELVIAILAAAKAGAAYVPLDPEYPPERLATMLADADPLLLLTQAHLADLLPGDTVHHHIIDAEAGIAASEPDGRPEVTVEGGHPAYLLFTSGSTGRPKAVSVPQAGLANRLDWMQDRYRLGPDDAVLQKTPYGFDVSVWEFFWPLLTGARLVLAGPGEHRDPDRLCALIEEHRVTTAHFVPAMLHVFLNDLAPARCGSLRRILCSGEALPHALRERCLTVLPTCELHNLYGPTEASIDVTAWDCRDGRQDGSVPIGRLIDNMRCWVLGPALTLTPVGVAGELYLSGVGLARGYHGRADLTAAAFLPNPHADGDPQHRRLYRTGDIARWREDGALDYLGRSDFQVKIRGQRVELGEIEAALAALPGISEAVVAARGSNGAASWLVAWLVPQNGAPPPGDDSLREMLARTLPDHMIPSAFLWLERMPVTPNGKVDRKNLPDPRNTRSASPPTTGTETALAAIWQAVLQRNVTDRAAHFFLAGGHSLLVPQLAARIREKFGIELDLLSLMKVPTMHEQAALIDHRLALALTSTPLPAPADGFERIEL